MYDIDTEGLVGKGRGPHGAAGHGNGSEASQSTQYAPKKMSQWSHRLVRWIPAVI